MWLVNFLIIMVVNEFIGLFQQQNRVKDSNRTKTVKMSICEFPNQNCTVNLQVPSFSHINSTMLLIQTNKNISFRSTLSLSSFQKQLQHHQAINQKQDSLGLLIQDQCQILQCSGQSNIKKKNNKGACTCKKTNCLKMYCECFSTGRMCTSQCACFGCYNQEGHQQHIQIAKAQLKHKGTSKNGNADRACNCKKTQCQKKYCQCYNSGLSCTQACNCTDCCNKGASQRNPQEKPVDIGPNNQSDNCWSGKLNN